MHGSAVVVRRRLPARALRFYHWVVRALWRWRLATIVDFLGPLVLMGLLVPACGSGAATETGTLEGDVTIGPISPVQREGVKEVISPDVYAARKVVVYDRGGRRVIEEVDLEDDGHYSVDLKPGIYMVDINRLGIDSSDEVPREVEIRAGETVLLDIDIDTGIR